MHSYSSVSARHYTAYRPPLHRPILETALHQRRFAKALDVGCGVGHSCKALLPFCDRVIGLDSSPQMISSAEKHPCISYVSSPAGTLPAREGPFDLVSLAGVLPYLDVTPLADKLKRVCRRSAMVLVYDFKIDLDGIVAALNLPHTPSMYDYNHATNLSGAAGYTTLDAKSEQMSFSVTSRELASLLLANEDRARCIADCLGQEDPTNGLVLQIDKKIANLTLSATTWYALHRQD
ncbi:MAG: class I SAM-dependent methyltransferase [Pseudomonadota bacterium]